LKYYGLELHHLTPLGILYIATFVPLCEAFMVIELHFDLWNHFFRVQLLRGSGMEVVVLGGVDIHFKSEHGVDPYFDLTMLKSVNGWWKMWLFLWNDADVPLPMLTSNRPIPQPN
jgi:hypothetical protein